MKATEKGPEGPVTAAAGEKPDFVESAVQLYTTGIERVAEAQKKALDLALEHNAEMVITWKKQAWAAPGFFMFDLTTAAFDRFAETQKGAIDLVVEQSRTLGGIVKERKLNMGKLGEDGMAKAQEAIDQSAAAQKTALDYATKQTKAAFETAKKQLNYAGTPAGAAADSFQRGIEVVIDAQKEMLDAFKAPQKNVH